MFLLFHERGVGTGKLLHHASSGRRADIEPLGERVGAGRFAICGQLADVIRSSYLMVRISLFQVRWNGKNESSALRALLV